ncbi:MAG: tetratricopeptide repeat protein, partial [Phycisphaerales bacterium JB039]
ARCLTVRGRLLIPQGEFEEAVQALRDAVDRGMASIDVQRLLASAQMQLGRSNDALRTLRSALAADPSNFRTIMQTLETLLALGRYDEALRLARESESYAGVNDAFVHTWLQLEAEVGDIALAQRRREEILTNRPEDQANRLALAQIYVQQRDRRAPQLIEQIRAENDSLAAVDLQARWRLSQGDNDGAAAIYRQYIDGLDEGDRDNALNAYLAFYRLVRSTGDTDAAIAVLEEARAVQDPQIMQADFTLARLYAELSRPAQAADAYQRILDGGAADEDGLLRLSLAEASISAGDAQKAISVLDALPDRLRASPGAEILRSEAMRAMGRTADADRMLDDAIARAPDYPAGFYKRAELALAAVRQDDGAMSGATRTAMLNDAIADLTRSIELSPAFWPALQLRADAHLMAGRLDDAVRDVDRAVAVNPALAPMLLQIIDRLLSQERFTDAARVAEQATRSHPEDFALLQAIGDRFVAAGRSAEAIALYNTAWNASRNTAIAARLVELTLGLPSPDLRRAREVISDPALSVDESPALLMLRARLEKAAGRPQQMLADARKSLELVIDKPEALRFWLEGSQKLFDESQRADWLRFMGEAQLGRAPDGWGFALLGSMLVQRPDTIQQGMELLEQVVETSSDPIAASAAGGDLGSAYFALGRHEEAVAAWKQSLERRPSPEIANNIAFTLADDLGRPDEALPFAQQAVEGRPTDPSILDTLGVVQTRLGMYEEAAGTLQAALQYAGQSPERSGPVLMHLSRLEAQRGNKTEAAEYLERARTALQGPSGARYRETLEGLQKQIDQL